MSIDHKLNAIRETVCKALDKVGGESAITLTDQPRTDQLAIGVDGNPGPNVPANFLFGHRGRDVPLLGRNEAPQFVGQSRGKGQVEKVRYCVTNGWSTIATGSLATMLHIVQRHVAQQEVARSVQNWVWTAETADPAEFLSLCENQLQRDRLPAQPTESY